MRPSIIRDEAGVSSWVWIGGGGLVVVFAFVFYLFSQVSDPVSGIDPRTQASIDDFNDFSNLGDVDGDGDLDAFITDDVLAGFDQRHTTGFGDILPLNTPAIGQFEFVDPNFVPLSRIEPGTTPHLIIASDGSPPMDTWFPIKVEVFDPVTGDIVWRTTLDGDPNHVCRGDDGCSINGPPIDELLPPDLQDPLAFYVQASSGEVLLAEGVWIPAADDSGSLTFDGTLDDLKLWYGGPPDFQD